MNVKSAPIFAGLFDWVNNRSLNPQQLLTTSETFVAASEQSQSKLTSTAGIDQVNYSRVCLHRAHTTSKRPHIINPETYMCVCSCSFHIQPSERANRRRNGRSSIGLQDRRPFHNRLFSSSNGSQEKPQTSLTRQSNNR